MEKPPCVECERRSPACWGSCDQYKAWKAEKDAAKKMLVEKKTHPAEMYHAEAVIKNKKRRKAKK